MLRFAKAPVKEFALVAGAALVLSTVCYGQGLAYRLEPELGVPYQGSTTMVTSTGIQIPGMDVDVSMTVRMGHDVMFEAGPDDTVVGHYTATSVSVEVGGMPEAPFDLNDLYQGMVGMTLTIVLSRGGDVVQFDGFEAMMEAVLDRLEAPDEVRAGVSQFLEANFGEDQVKQMSGQSGLSLPDHPVAVGDSWTNSVSAFGLDIDTTYTLTDRADGLAFIDATATISGAEDAGFELPGVPDIPGMEMRFEELSGALSGSYELDEATGLTSAYSVNMTMEMDMVMDMPEVEDQPTAASMSMSQTTETTVEGTLRKAE